MKFLNKAFLLALSVIMLFTACGETTSINGEALAKEIVDEVDFKDEISLIPQEIALTLYQFDQSNLKSIYTYLGSGATAEEVTVVQFNSLTDKDKEILEGRIESQIKIYETYIPKEIERIKKNVIIYSGNTAILCISDDNEAEKEIKELLK